MGGRPGRVNDLQGTLELGAKVKKYGWICRGRLWDVVMVTRGRPEGGETSRKPAPPSRASLFPAGGAHGRYGGPG